MNKRILYFLFAILELSLFSLIIFLGIKIKNLSQGKVKGIQYITQIKKEDVIFDSNKLKYFYEPKPNSTEKLNRDWLDHEVINSINADGLNERYDYPVQKYKDTYRIITLGDSFTFGQAVNTDENYSERLEDFLGNLTCKGINKFEVINLGVYGYDIDYEMERFIKRGLKYKPDLVIWLVGSGNFMKINERVLPRQSELISTGDHGFDPVSKRYIPLVHAINQTQKELGNDYIMNYQKNIFLMINKVYEGKLLILNYWSLNNDVKKIITSLKSLNNNYSFVENLFPYLEEKKYQLADRHPNKEAHRKIAEDIFTYLTKKGSISCN